jgi:hypothetical protein
MAVLFRAALMILLLATPALASQDWVEVRKNNAGFVLNPSGTSFVPWGFNYDRDYRSRLIEDYWEGEWDVVKQNFKEMKEFGASVVRINLQFARFMDGPDRPNQANLARLERLVILAEDLGLYLDITGLGSFRERDVPKWYSALTENERWIAQAQFWEAIASTCAQRPGVFAYNLMNEPLVTGERLSPGSWVHPNVLGGYHYLEYINLDRSGRERPEIARQWIHRMVEAIRKHDRRHMITVGLFPVDMHWPKPEEATGFSPAKIAPELDFLSVHLYPGKGEVDLALDVLRRYRTEKPLVVEETYALNCSFPEFQSFLERSRGIAQGWLGFYWGQTQAELASSPKPGDRIMLQWLRLFPQMNPNRVRYRRE